MTCWQQQQQAAAAAASSSSGSNDQALLVGSDAFLLYVSFGFPPSKQGHRIHCSMDSIIQVRHSCTQLGSI